MNLTFETGISSITVFFQGLVSFFSPCVLPLIPLYIGYLSGGAKTTDEEGNITYKRSRVMRNTLFFVLGVSFAFFLLGFSFTAVGKFFHNYQTWFTRIGGIIVVLFGLYQLGLFGSSSLSKEHRFHFQPDSLAMNPLTALILGFTFSFAWTPCVGPALASVLLLAASASSSATGFLLIGADGKLNPNATLGYVNGDYLFLPDNWYDELFDKGNLRQEYNVSISGNSDKINYYASLGYLDDSGIMSNSGFTRYSTRLKADYQAKKWLKFGANVSYSNVENNNPTNQTSSGSSANIFYLTGMIAPIYPLYIRNAEGSVAKDSHGYTKIGRASCRERVFRAV